MDALWHVFGGSPVLLGAMLIGLVVTVAGPWAIIKAVSRPSKADAED